MREKQVEAVDVYAGKRLRERRKELGISQTALAQAAGITFQQIQKYEKGRNRMGSSRLHQLAIILKVPVPYFFEDVPAVKSANGTDTAYISEFTASPDGKRLVKAFQAINDKELRRHLVGMIERLAQNC